MRKDSVSAVPIGKVKWYDAEKGFGFVSNPGEEDCYVGKNVLPEGVTELHPGQKIEFDFAAGRKGPQALRVKLVDQPRMPRRALHTYSPEQLDSMLSDVMSVLESRVQPGLRAGRYPDRKEGRQVAEILRVIAAELDV